MTYIFKKYALYYHKQYGLAVAFKAVNGTPLHNWREYAETGMDEETVKRLHFEHVERKNRQAIRLAILTGPYMKDLEKPMLIIDIDEPPVDGDEEKKLELMKTFAKEGYQVVNTPRGFHLHVFIEKGEELPYVMRISRIDEEEKLKSIGEGGCLFPHPWSTVPSVRPLGDNKWMRYSFVLPNGKKIAKYEKFLQYRHELEPSTMRLNDVIEDISFLLSAKVSFFRPKTGFKPKMSVDGREIIRKRPIFYYFEEFYSAIWELPLPTCVAWVLYHYANETGDELTASRLATFFEDFYPLYRRVEHGMRFLVASAVSLFLAHVIEWIKYDEIMDVIQYAFEDWPEDEGYPLDKKLSYLFLMDEEGYVYPRYGGLGTLTPTQVWDCTETCLFGRMCGGRNPWRPFIRMVKRKIIGKIIYTGPEESEESEE